MYRFDGKSNTRHFHLKTLTYGTASAPFLAISSLQFISQSIGKEEKQLQNMITKGFYLDDLIYGSDDEAETRNLVNKIYTLFEKHRMTLQKWSSNFLTCLPEIKGDHTLLDLKEIVKAENKVSTLGMSWNPKADTPMYKICLGDDKSFTKRMILSEAARTFDPTGLLLPLTIRARLSLTSL
jgi:Pao retrotransposon peptidase